MLSANLKLAVLVPITSRAAGVGERATGHNIAKPFAVNDASKQADKNALNAVLEGLSKLAASLVSSTGDPSGLRWGGLRNTSGCASAHSCMVLLGIDADDALLLHRKHEISGLFTETGVPAEILELATHEPGALCQIWASMAEAAVRDFGCNLAVLLGDDTELSPPDWPAEVLIQFQQTPDLMLLILNDAADPGFPSFPVVRVDRHLEVFGGLLPECFVNQGGDPYLAALYRRWRGAAQMLPGVTVRNTVGGVQRADQPYTAPRYIRNAVGKETVLKELRLATVKLETWHRKAQTPSVIITSSGSNSSSDADPHSVADAPAGPDISNGVVVGTETAVPQRQLAVDVLVPSYRVDLNYLSGIADAVLSKNIPGCNLQLVIVVDQPANGIGAKQKAWLHQLQQKHLNKVRIRFHEQNMGASAARNRALQESLAEYVVFWDDDITPSSHCLAVYAQAIKEHPQAKGFVGPSYVTKDPGSVWACAVHNADALFFWDAAEDWKVAEFIPWAVTANVCLINTADEFDLRFPKTGGGEDVDFCLKVTGGKLVPVPQAAVHHPLWNNSKRCYGRFFGWAYGDGAFIAMYPELCYFNWPNSAEVLCTLLLLACAAAAAAAGFAGAAAVAAAVAWHTGHGLQLQYCMSVMIRYSIMALTAATGYKMVDLLLDIVRAFHPIRTTKHPCNTILIRLAAATEASLIKTWSEVGRLWGLVCRKELLHWPAAAVQLPTGLSACPALEGVRLIKRFDWFCGLSPEVVAAERARGFWRFIACSAGSWAALSAVALLRVPGIGGIGSPYSGNASVVHVLTACAAVLPGCCLMLWRLEG